MARIILLALALIVAIAIIVMASMWLYKAFKPYYDDAPTRPKDKPAIIYASVATLALLALLLGLYQGLYG